MGAATVKTAATKTTALLHDDRRLLLRLRRIRRIWGLPLRVAPKALRFLRRAREQILDCLGEIIGG